MNHTTVLSNPSSDRVEQWGDGSSAEDSHIAAHTAVEVSVIVPVRNAEVTLPNQLEALAGQRCPQTWEIIVVDNGSTDATKSVALSWQAKIEHLRVITSAWHPGSGHARNTGARMARGRLLLCCDADDVVADGWVAAMATSLQTHDLVGGVIERSELNSPTALACRPGTGSDLLNGFCYLPYVSSASLGLRRTMWDEVGGFDEHYVAGGDIDLCWRVQLAGGRIGTASDAVVHYRLRRTLGATMRQLHRYGHAHARLYSQYALVGMPPSTRTLYDPVRAWRRILGLMPHVVRSRSARMTLCANLAFRGGRLAGSIRHRVFYL